MIESITGTIKLDSGEEVEFFIGPEGWSQWGAEQPVLGQTVYLTTDLSVAAQQYLGQPVE